MGWDYKWEWWGRGERVKRSIKFHKNFLSERFAWWDDPQLLFYEWINDWFYVIKVRKFSVITYLQRTHSVKVVKSLLFLLIFLGVDKRNPFFHPRSLFTLLDFISSLSSFSTLFTPSLRDYINYLYSLWNTQKIFLFSWIYATQIDERGEEKRSSIFFLFFFCRIREKFFDFSPFQN